MRNTFKISKKTLRCCRYRLNGERGEEVYPGNCENVLAGLPISSLFHCCQKYLPKHTPAIPEPYCKFVNNPSLPTEQSPNSSELLQESSQSGLSLLIRPLPLPSPVPPPGRLDLGSSTSDLAAPRTPLPLPS